MQVKRFVPTVDLDIFYCVKGSSGPFRFPAVPIDCNPVFRVDKGIPAMREFDAAADRAAVEHLRRQIMNVFVDLMQVIRTEFVVKVFIGRFAERSSDQANYRNYKSKHFEKVWAECHFKDP